MEENKKYPKSVDGNRFEYEDGKKSQTFAFVCDYTCDWALVGVGVIGVSYYFRHVDGKMDGPFSFADDYKHGFALVKKQDDDKYYYRDVDGGLSGGYYKATSYSTSRDKAYPVAIVQEEENGSYHFRDVNGNLSEPYAFLRPDRMDYYGIKNKGDKISKMTIEDVKASISKNMGVFAEK